MTVIGSQDNGIDVPPVNEFASIMETPKVIVFVDCIKNQVNVYET